MTNLATQIQALVEERGQKIDSLCKLVETMSKEKRDFNEVEQKSYDETKKEVESISKRIDVLKEQLEREKDTVRFIPGAPNSDTGAGEKTEKNTAHRQSIYTTLWPTTLSL